MLAIKAFREMGGDKPWNPERTHLVIDHASPAPNERIARLHDLMREFSTATGVKLYDVGEDGLRLLAPCDGRFSLQQILAALARYDGPVV